MEQLFDDLYAPVGIALALIAAFAIVMGFVTGEFTGGCA